MTTTQVTTWRRYTPAEKKAYQARVRRRAWSGWGSRREQIEHIARTFGMPVSVLL